MDEENEKMIDMERTYLQLVRFSHEIHEDLSVKEKLIDTTYKRYLIEAQELIAKWQISSEKSKHLYQSEGARDEAAERIDELKKKFVRNMQSVRVRLQYLNPSAHFCAKAKNLRKKLIHYLELKNQQSKRPQQEIQNEIDSARNLIEMLLCEPISSDEVDAEKAKLQELIKNCTEC